MTLRLSTQPIPRTAGVWPSRRSTLAGLRGIESGGARGWRALALGLALAGCDGDAQSLAESPVLRVSIVSALGATPPSYRVILVGRDSEVWVQDCPAPGESDAAACTPSGIAVYGNRAPRRITVKAPGYAWQTVGVEKSDTSSELSIQLSALEPFETTENLATGLGPSGGVDAFEALAAPVETELGLSQSVKFIITDLAAEPHVYLQNTRKHPLHYDFARTVLGMPLSLSEFESAAYHGADRDILAGTLVAYPELQFESRVTGRELRAPITLNFFPSDDATPEQVLVAHRLLEERLLFGELGGDERRLVYLPAGDRQERDLDQSVQDFAERDALWTDLSELYRGVDEQVLNPGLAYGTLRLVSPEDLQHTVLAFEDIVVLTRLPNDLPLVGGTITAELQTPLAHVNLAARARGTPNLALRGADGDPRIAPLIGHMVRFEVTTSGFTLSEASEDEAREYWNTLAPDPVFPPSDVADHGLPSFEEVGFAGAAFCGPKAANLGELRQLLGDQAAPGFVVPFWAYDQHMRTVRVTSSQCDEAHRDCRAEGRDETLCAAALELCSASEDESLYDYAHRLTSDEGFGHDAAVREAALDSLAYLIRHAPVDEAFAARLDARVAEVLGEAQVRLRSSTNAEDLPNFSGAGLYESVSAFARGNKRASSRIQEVWASVLSYPAFEERRLWGIDHLSVRMGVAVNPAVDDEQANGVLITQNIANPNIVGMYVNVQLGEISVTNPENGALPEVFSILPDPSGGVQVARQRTSSLSPDEPLLSDEEIRELAGAASRVQAHFAPLYEMDASVLALDLEFKFRGPERALLIKQARPYATRSDPSP